MQLTQVTVQTLQYAGCQTKPRIAN